MKICKECGKNFEGYKSQKICLSCKGKSKSKQRRFIKIGDTYGFFRVDSIADKSYLAYNCHCLKCGQDFIANGGTIFASCYTGCGNCKKNEKKCDIEEKYNSYVGKIYENLEIIKFAGYKTTKSNLKNGKVRYQNYPVMLCKCKLCEKNSEIELRHILSGDATKCKNCRDKKFVKSGNDIISTSSINGTSVIAIDGRRKKNKNNSSGYNGISTTESGKYRAYINFKRKQYHLGVYEDKEDALAARKLAEQKIYGDFIEWYKKEFPEKWEKLEETRKER